MTVPGALRRTATDWLADDPDEATRTELRQLLEAAETDDAAATELADRFSRRLEFGTAGLRGEIGAGPNRMNRAVVIAAAAGLAAYLREQGCGPESTVVVGYDARHGSHRFAQDTAEVMRGAGFEAAVLPRPLPTPVLAYAIRSLGCVAGVMVTASHNPPRDNGYKVYLGDGSQIVPPADADISRHIAAVGAVSRVPRAGGERRLGDEIVEEYVAAVAGLVSDDSPRDLTVVYTPLHGVGDDVLHRVLDRAGFSPPVVVPQQQQPDPDFPTVAFPNPEEPGAIDLAMALAADTGADLVVANDPDADRCAAAVPDGDGWRMLRGDELGVLLADCLLRRGVRGVYATTIVSSSLLRAMAADHGVPFTETLTGFKWIGRVPGLAFGYEEALGYCVAPQLVRDKDGVSAALLLVELAAGLRAAGSSLVDRLDEIAARHGVYATDSLSVRVRDRGEISAALQRLRERPPVSLGGSPVLRTDDLSRSDAGLPATEGLRYRLAAGGRVVVRPSGTEPKLKCYLEVVEPVEAPDAVARARGRAADRLAAVRRELAAAAGVSA